MEHTGLELNAFLPNSGQPVEVGESVHPANEQKSPALGSAMCKTNDAVRLSSIWKLHHATAICSAPWWTVLVVVINSILGLCWQFAFMGVLVFFLNSTHRSSPGTEAFIPIMIISAIDLATWVLGGRSIARFESLADASCINSPLAAWSIYLVPTLLFRAFPFVSTFLVLNELVGRWQSVRGWNKFFVILSAELNPPI